MRSHQSVVFKSENVRKFFVYFKQNESTQLSIFEKENLFDEEKLFNSNRSLLFFFSMSSVYTSQHKSCLISCYNFNKQTFIETEKYIKFRIN